MAYKTLNAQDTTRANAWMHDVLSLGGARTPKSGRNLFKTNDTYYLSVLRPFCEQIVQIILEGEFTNIDNALERLSKWYFNPDLNASDYETRGIKVKPNKLAEYIAAFCVANGIYWDDSIRSTMEIDSFKATLLGTALEAFGGFVSQPLAVARTRVARAARSSAGTSSADPKNPYKSEGPKSEFARDLKSIPHKKEMLSGTSGYVFSISGVNTRATKVKAFAFIKPLDDKGAKGSTNKVNIGSSNGYSDCKLYFETATEADNFLVQCKTICPSWVTDLEVVKKSVDKNGYFKIGTEFGDAYISAVKLNEAIDHYDRGLEEWLSDFDAYAGMI